MFANVDLEERMLFGQSRSEANCSGTRAMTGTVEKPQSSTEVMIASSKDDSANDTPSEFRMAIRELLAKR